jgi:hypothetical protein
VRPSLIPDQAAKVPHDPLFDSAWLKWGRAVVHAQDLVGDLDTFGGVGGPGPMIAVRAAYEPRRHGFAINVVDIDPMPPTWGLILGDIANNLRSAVDHLAWALVSRGRTPPATLNEKQRRQVYFPICNMKDKFNESLARMLPGARRADVAIVRRYQPYHHGTRRGRWFALTILIEINTPDKHRSTARVWAIPITCEIEVAQQHDCAVRLEEVTAKRRPLESGAELSFVRARRTGPDPRISVIPHLTAEPTFTGRVLMREWLQIVLWWVQWLLYEFSDIPDDLAAVGVDMDRLNAILGWRKPSPA